MRVLFRLSAWLRRAFFLCRSAASGVAALVLLCAAAATANPAEASKFPTPMPVPSRQEAAPSVAETWAPLIARLHKDGVAVEYLHGVFSRMGDVYSSDPMGAKITELFINKYVPRPPRTAPAPRPAAPPVYRGMITPENVVRCKHYIGTHAAAFSGLEERFGVPKEVVVGLLMVETRLGTFLGRNSSFWSLACMATADTRERVEGPVRAFPLPMTPDREEWLQQILRERSAWAYRELLALIGYSRANALDPLSMPGSLYGAIGICQFMPSNLPKFAVDGDKDGRVDLYNPADAILSVGNYLKEHGWSGRGWKGKERAAHHAVLKRYNKSNVYANTILALADAVAAPSATVAAAPLASRKSVGKAKPAAVKSAKKRPAPKAALRTGKKAPVKPAAKTAPAGKTARAMPKPGF